MSMAHYRAHAVLRAHILLAKEQWPEVDLSDVRMTFDLRGMSAGRAWWKRGLIELNGGLMRGVTVTEMCEQTLPHELAHIIAGRLQGRGAGHGKLWKHVMQVFGLEPERCHNMEVEHLKTRHERSYPATCGCGDRTLSIRRGNKMKRIAGYYYTCRKCGERIAITGPAQ